MLNEIKEIKEGKSSNKKPKIKEKNIKLKNNIDNINIVNKNIFTETQKINNSHIITLLGSSLSRSFFILHSLSLNI